MLHLQWDSNNIMHRHHATLTFCDVHLFEGGKRLLFCLDVDLDGDADKLTQLEESWKHWSLRNALLILLSRRPFLSAFHSFIHSFIHSTCKSVKEDDLNRNKLWIESSSSSRSLASLERRHHAQSLRCNEWSFGFAPDDRKKGVWIAGWSSKRGYRLKNRQNKKRMSSK